MSEVFAAPATYPLSRAMRFITRRNRLADLTEYRTPDLLTPKFEWDLDLGPLSDAEITAVENFFASHGGPYESFVFLDRPTAAPAASKARKGSEIARSAI